MKHIFLVMYETDYNAYDAVTELMEDEHIVAVTSVPESFREFATMALHLQEALAQHGEHVGDPFSLGTEQLAEIWEQFALDRPFLLVEESTRDSRRYLTLHKSLEDAGDYQVNQEYAGDWSLLEVIDLRSGESYEEASTTVTFKKKEPSVG